MNVTIRESSRHAIPLPRLSLTLSLSLTLCLRLSLFFSLLTGKEINSTKLMASRRSVPIKQPFFRTTLQVAIGRDTGLLWDSVLQTGVGLFPPTFHLPAVSSSLKSENEGILARTVYKRIEMAFDPFR